MQNNNHNKIVNKCHIDLPMISYLFSICLTLLMIVSIMHCYVKMHSPSVNSVPAQPKSNEMEPDAQSSSITKYQQSPQILPSNNGSPAHHPSCLSFTNIHNAHLLLCNSVESGSFVTPNGLHIFPSLEAH